MVGASRSIFTPSRRGGRIAAVTAAVGFACIAMFQGALAAGVPWGDAAWGGAHAHLSTGQRIGSAVAVFVWAVAALVVLGRAGVWRADRRVRLFRWGTWILAAVSGVGAVMNFASQSLWENLIWGPTAVALAVLCVIVACTAPKDQPPGRQLTAPS